MMTIEEIKTELREMIALAESQPNWRMSIQKSKLFFKYRTITPLACKGLLLAIEDLEGRANSYRGDASQMSAIKRIEEIRQLWEESK
jgi:hypothetical protein